MRGNEHRIKDEILKALQHPEAEEGLYLGTSFTFTGKVNGLGWREIKKGF